MDERTARMALACVVDAGDPALVGLFALHSGVEIWESLRHGHGEGAWARRAKRLDVSAVVEATERAGLRFAIPGDEEWPESASDLDWCDPVQQFAGAPVGLWLAGPRRLDEVVGGAAIVGSRAATSYGEYTAQEIAAGLAEAGRPVWSGGAYGIDVAAHRGALAAGGVTVAILAGGLDQPYPAGHAPLFDRLRHDHLLVSEYAPGEHPTRPRFLVRNRLIVALSKVTVVVEAAERSGARNTAHWAKACGRSLLAVPGSVESAMSRTPHRLIRDGEAILVTSAADVLEALEPLGSVAPIASGSDPHRRPLDGLSEVESRVREALPRRGGASASEVALVAGLEIGPCLAALSELEDRGWVSRDDHGAWRPATRAG